GGPPRVADEDSHKAEEGQEGEQACLGALLEIHVVDLFDPLESWPVLQPRVLEGPCPRTGEGTLHPCLPRDPPVVSPGADIERDEPLADIPRLARGANERGVGLFRPAVHVDYYQNASHGHKHTTGDHDDPEPSPGRRGQLVAVGRNGEGGLQREGHEEGHDQVVTERYPVVDLLLT